eukprot:2599894-Rhodomonas_salina.1
MLAASAGSLEAVKWIVEKGADIQRAKNDGRTALIIAAEYGHEECVKYLVGVGADIYAEKDDGWTALMCAAAEGFEGTVKFLLQRATEHEKGAGDSPE